MTRSETKRLLDRAEALYATARLDVIGYESASEWVRESQHEAFEAAQDKCRDLCRSMMALQHVLYLEDAAAFGEFAQSFQGVQQEQAA